MKKIKSLKTLSSLGAIVAITPIVATACNSDDKEKTEISSIPWSNSGDYLTTWSADQVVTLFKQQNPEGQNNIPENIYSEVDVVATKVSNVWATITVSARSDSSHYTGSKVLSIVAKTELADLNWKFDNTNYYVQLKTSAAIVAQFKANNIPGRDNLPLDIYDQVDVVAIPNPQTSSWTIKITPMSNSTKYCGECSADITLTKYPIEEINWVSASINASYDETMDDGKVAATFIKNNPAGQNGIPSDIYSYVTVSAKQIESIWRISVTANLNNPYYQGSITITPVVCGYMIYDGKTYIFPDNLNINNFCSANQSDPWSIYTSNGSIVTINDKTKLTELAIPTISSSTKLGDNFLAGCTNLKQISFGAIGKSGLENTKTIGNNFMKYCASIEKVNINVFSSIESIGDDFMFMMSDNTKLEGVNGMTSLSNLKSIGNNFLSNCTGLKSDNIDLSGLTNLETIGNNFMSGCNNNSFTKLNFNSLTSLKTIGTYFLSDCTKLTDTLSLSKVKNLENIGNNFLNGCTSLTTIDLSSLTKLVSFGTNFAYGCSNLKTLELNGLSSLKELDNNHTFILNCNNVESINLRGASSLIEIPNDFGCYPDFPNSLKSFILSDATSLIKIGDNFLEGRSNLTTVDISNASNLKTIGDDFLYKDKNLCGNESAGKPGYVKFSGLKKLESIGNRLISGSYEDTPIDKITELDLSGMVNLKSVGNLFLHLCTNLKKLTFGNIGKGWDRIVKIGDNFLDRAYSIQELDFQSFSRLETIGEHFLSKTLELKKLDMSNMVSLTKVGQAFLYYDSDYPPHNSQQIYLPLKNPKGVFNSNNFMHNVPKSEKTKLYAAEYTNLYKDTSPWDGYSDQFVAE